MLSEIYCEEFHQKKISFNQGFNVVLGTPKAHSNSVGKSTLLLIVDFILGGETYINSTDIIRHIGEHTIYFKFNFNSQDYYFARDTNDKNFVWKCDDDYSKKEKISTTEYCQWLAEKYHIVKFKSTLREIIGRYIRVNGKSNDNNPNKPLDKHNKETAENAMFALLKLFDMYKVVNDLVVNKKQSDKELSDYKNAQKHDFIPKIGKRKFNSNERQIEKNIEEINSIQDKINTNDLDTVLVEQSIDLKKELSYERRIFNKLKTQLSVFDENAEYSFSATEKNFEELLNFFDFANIKHISEIENFHKKISNILSEELKQGKEQVQIQFEKQELIVKNLEEQLKVLIGNTNATTMMMEQYAKIIKDNEQMENENKSYLKLQELNKIKKENQDLLNDAKRELFDDIKQKLNSKMKEINNSLYTEKHTAPEIEFGDTNYSFKTPDDTGTGSAYKGLVVFDLAILRLTDLPILVHDSLILISISDEAVQNILQQYIDCGKQVIIALDKQDSYSDKTASILKKYAVIELAPNEQALFGRSWNKQKFQAA